MAELEYDDEDNTLASSLLFFGENDEVGDKSNPDKTDSQDDFEDPTNKFTEILLLNQPFQTEDFHKDLVYRQNIIYKYMGSMAQCRGKNGVALREAGALKSLVLLLHMTINHHLKEIEEETDNNVIRLIIAALGALRDLACGDATNRLEIGETSVGANEDQSGLDMIVFFIARYHNLSWTDILGLPNLQGTLELKMLTSAGGAIRNITHSNRCNCQKLHKLGLTDLFIWRLRHGSNSMTFTYEGNGTSKQRLPAPSNPWREACFRIASSLINMSEKSADCAVQCADDDELIYILLESWGGVAIYKDQSANRFPVLHLGLLSILNERIKRQGSNYELEELINSLLQREYRRKKSAQDREQKRKSANNNKENGKIEVFRR